MSMRDRGTCRGARDLVCREREWGAQAGAPGGCPRGGARPGSTAPWPGRAALAREPGATRYTERTPAADRDGRRVLDTVKNETTVVATSLSDRIYYDRLSRSTTYELQLRSTVDA